MNLGGAAAIVAIALSATAAVAQNSARYDLVEQDLAAALKAFAAASGREVIAPSDILRGKRGAAVAGTLTADRALAQLLAGTGLGADLIAGAFVIRPLSAPGERGGASNANNEYIVVTGSRIRGAPVASPVIIVNQEQFRNAGQSSLGEVVRSIPQSFGGGQNPGVGTNVPTSSGVDIGGGSSLNLRGLGSDATLTLLNGHRLSYSASRQSVDLSAIPLAAVERLEIVADGASALYGSDAVAGVANVILRRNVNGLEASARLGASTDGGNFQQVYGALGGASWLSGDVMVAYEYGSNSAILSRDRIYAATRAPGLTIYPALRHHSAVLNANQRVAAGITLDVDALYNNRKNSSVFPLNAAGDLDVSSGRSFGMAESYALTSVLRADLGGDWRAALTGSYGRDRVDFLADLFFAGTKVPAGAGYYQNIAKTIEIGGDGTLFQLPGGKAKLAAGAGYRTIGFAVFRGSTSFQNVARAQDSYFGYGELNLPLISADQEMAFIDRLSLSAALRYESYPGVGDVVTPKLGLIYAPVPDLAVKASWGRSFRAPTLLQQYNPASATLIRAITAGGVGYPASATVLLVQGGNAALKPEKAETFSATLDVHPRAFPEVSLELSYFSTRYRDRIVTPIAATAVALSNPIYSDLIALDPSDTAIDAAIASAGTFVNAAGAVFDSANVVAIVNNSNVNAGRQNLRGVDVLFTWLHRLRARGSTVAVTLNGAYLNSEQQLSAGQPVVPLAGTLFNPPHVRARGILTWSANTASLSGALNYTGPADDLRFTPVRRIGSVTTLDLTARISTGASSGLLRDIELSVSALNALNATPTPIRTTLFTDAPYDSTNYSPVGRFISLAISKKW